MGIKTPNSLKKELELGLVLKLEIGETSRVAPLFFDFFVSLSISQSDVIPAGSLWLIMISKSVNFLFFSVILKYININLV